MNYLLNTALPECKYIKYDGNSVNKANPNVFGIKGLVGLGMVWTSISEYWVMTAIKFDYSKTKIIG